MTYKKALKELEGHVFVIMGVCAILKINLDVTKEEIDSLFNKIEEAISKMYLFKSNAKRLEKALDKAIEMLVKNKIRIETSKPIGQICSLSFNGDETYLVETEEEWNEYLSEIARKELENGK